MDFRILGPIEAWTEGRPLPLGGERQRALLAYLLLHANEVVAGERLLDELWTNAPSGRLAALHTQVSRLRRIVGDRIVTSGSGYAIRVEPGELDLERFRTLLARVGAASDPAERARLLREADALWRGVALDGLDVPFAGAETAALEELRLAALEDRLEADLELGHYGELVSELSGLVARHRLRERLRGHLILALYRSGRQAEALEAYRQARLMLDEELGLEPSPALRDLELAILRHDPALTRVAPPKTKAPATAPRTRRGTRLVAAVAAVLAAAAGAAFVAMGNGRDDAGTAAPAPRADGVAAPVALPVHHVSRARPRPHAAPTHAAKPVKRSLSGTSPHRTTGRSTAAARTPATPKAVRPAAKTTPPVAARSRPRLTVAKPQPKPVTSSDSFDGDFVDPTIWHQVTTDANVSIAEQDGRLLVTLGAGAVPGGTYDMIDVHVGTQCSFPGDFDARVDYTLLEWPSADNVVVGLSAIFAGAVVGRESGTQSGDQYTSWVGPTNGSVPLPEGSGSLRIARIDGIATTYMWHRGGWSRLAVGTSRGAAVLGLQAMWADRQFPFGGQEVKVAFDNFTVTGVSPICPPGTY
jgi:DNA-binding SARP family transcriptional activator